MSSTLIFLIFFSSTRGHQKKRRNGAEVESADEQHVEAGEQKEEVEHQVGEGQVGQVDVDKTMMNSGQAK